MLQNLYFVILKLNASISAGLSNLTSLSFKRSNAVTAEGMRAFANLVNLLNLDLEGCPKIHGGLIHLKGLLWSSWTFTTFWVVDLKYQLQCLFIFPDLTKLESLNMRYCNYIANSDIKYLTGSIISVCFCVSLGNIIWYQYVRQSSCLDRNLSIVIFNIVKFIRWHSQISHFCMVDDHLSFVDLTNLKDLQLSCCKITDLGVSYIRGKQYDKFLLFVWRLIIFSVDVPLSALGFI